MRRVQNGLGEGGMAIVQEKLVFVCGRRFSTLGRRTIVDDVQVHCVHEKEGERRALARRNGVHVREKRAKDPQ